MRKKLNMLIVFVLVSLTYVSVQAAEWGSLSGRFIYDGEPPQPDKARVTSDQQVCGKHDLVVERLLVHPENRGVRNIIVYLYQNKSGRRQTDDDKKDVPIHESYQDLIDKPVMLDNNKCRFDPHVALIWTMRKVVIGNSDPIGHNVKIDTRENPESNDTVPSGATLEKQYANPERLPAGVSCSIHPWMKGWLVIRDTPYMAVTAEDGRFEIANLPVGKWRFMFWQEAAGYVSTVKIDGKAEQWRRGILEVEIKPGENSLGEVFVAPDLFK